MNYTDKKMNEDFSSIRTSFPALERKINGKSLVYLDNAATTLKPQTVIDRLAVHYLEETSNIHRGVHTLSSEATENYEQVREKIRNYIGASETREIVFTSGTTDSINLVAQSWGAVNLKENDEILISYMEHHSNIVPWQMIAQRTGANLKIIPITDDGELDIEQFSNLIGPRTKLLSVVHVSNSLGSINPIHKLTRMAHKYGALVLVDGAQAIAHMPIDVTSLGVDFYCFSSHKLFGPTGVGVLYGKKNILETMSPYKGGGDMIKSVTFDKTIYNDIPYRFEAGTPHIAGVIGFGASIDWVLNIGLQKISKYEQWLLFKATEALSKISGVRIIGTAKEKSAIISFIVEGIHSHDIGTIADQYGVALRTGHHCTQPVMERFGIPATARASFSIYNTEEDINSLSKAIIHSMEVFS